METLKEVMYVSQNAIPKDSVDTVLPRLVQAARINNKALGISGSLIFSGHRFAQCLQGSARSVDALMQLIATDPRHTNVCVVIDRPIERATYYGWGLHYSGPSVYVDRHLKAVMTSADGPRDERAVERLSKLMLELAEGELE